MRWEEKTSRHYYFQDLLFSQEIVYFAYSEGLINWNVYQKALDKINSNMNGGWMFEKGDEKIEFGKVYED
jgi:hypothetical protein